jgi:hypothetical protein
MSRKTCVHALLFRNHYAEFQDPALCPGLVIHCCVETLFAIMKPRSLWFGDDPFLGKYPDYYSMVPDYMSSSRCFAIIVRFERRPTTGLCLC